ncbi:hypothetical protein ACFVU2_01360 [Leifsonia sp. NPDC058194]|uniref:hypothetical protein n=1 Tax=Leifsonia sp. NPDC058194 TaxID=3346374 RepID=UPI0036DD0A2D
MNGRRSFALVASAAAAVMLLMGCTSMGIVPSQSLRFDVKLTPAEARADLADRSDDVQSLLGGEWSNQDNFIASGCSDDRGFYYYGGRVRTEPVEDRRGAAERVVDWWKEQGYAVSRADWGETVVLGGMAENGMDITLHLGEERTWFDADGPCLVGDWMAISDDDLANDRNDFPREPIPTATPGPGEPTP